MKKFVIIQFIVTISILLASLVSCCEKKKTIDGVFEFDTEFAEQSLMQSLATEFDSDPISMALGGAFVAPMAKSLYNTIEFRKDGTAVMKDATTNVLLDTTYTIQKDSLFLGDLHFGITDNELTMIDNEILFKYKRKQK